MTSLAEGLDSITLHWGSELDPDYRFDRKAIQEWSDELNRQATEKASEKSKHSKSQLDEIESRGKENQMTLVERLKKEEQAVTQDAQKRGAEQLEKDLVDMPYVTIKKLLERDFSTAWPRNGTLFAKVRALAPTYGELAEVQEDFSLQPQPSWPHLAEKIEQDNFVAGYLTRFEERWNAELGERVEGMNSN